MGHKTILSLAGIYLVIFIDSLGASLIIPMLTPIVHNPDIGLMASGTEHYRNILYGVALGAFSLAMFFGSPLLGSLSDSLGRKKTLLICLAGLAASYSLMTFAIMLKSVWLFIGGRLVGGFFSGSLPVAQAAIIDVTEPDHRARFIGYIMFAVSLGYVIGPLVGGWLSNPDITPWFSLTTPFVFVAVLSVINLLALLLTFRDSSHTGSDRVPYQNPVRTLADAFRSDSARTCCILLLFMLVGWNTFFQFIGLFVTLERNFDPQTVSHLVAWAGFGLAVSFVALVGLALKYMKPATMVSLALFLMALCIGGALFVSHPYAQYALATIGACGFGLSYSGLMARLSASFDTDRQGSIMGLAAAIAAFSAGFSAFSFGAMANISPGAPLAAALACVVLALLLSCRPSLDPAATLQSQP
ncbi:MFS transporter [Haematospirillum jordaniae]|uniref:MFS transporter n=1 Tax=Haematospirillum jordaniae TaxID=1549855 RepID=UPI00143344CF|nr:MFS transporter [Haematospirillum jordaniae]NKD85259.1 MFS transporter [Haematospirillum jordaniae]